MIEHRDNRGRLIATEADKPGEVDMIARWALAGVSAPFSTADELLIPVPFSLVCIECDCEVSSDINTREQATAAGWADVDFTPEQASCNYEGLCPQCRIAEEAAK